MGEGSLLNGKYELIAIEKIDEIENPRSGMKDHNLAVLMDSIIAMGLIQPIRVSPHPTRKNRYQVIVGHRRLLAFKKLNAANPGKYDKIPAIVEKAATTIDHAMTMAIAENHIREAMNYQSVARGIHYLKTKADMSIAEISVATGIGATFLSRCYKLWKQVPADMQDKIGHKQTGERRSKNTKISPVQAEKVINACKSIRGGQTAEAFIWMKEYRKREMNHSEIMIFIYMIENGKTPEWAFEHYKDFRIYKVMVIEPVDKSVPKFKMKRALNAIYGFSDPLTCPDFIRTFLGKL